MAEIVGLLPPAWLNLNISEPSYHNVAKCIWKIAVLMLNEAGENWQDSCLNNVYYGRTVDF